MKTTKEIADYIGRIAYQALLEEVYTTPKPGLVDLYSCGAHRDMDVHTFEKSAAAISPYLTRMAEQGARSTGNLEELFLAIRSTGIAAEQQMFQATAGVNTHRGMIFSLGIFCAAAGRLMQQTDQIRLTELVAVEQQMTVRILTAELAALKERQAVSHGEKLLQKYNTTGIRGEAIDGYPAVFELAVPALIAGVKEHKDWNQVKLQTLLILMSRVEDSNILARNNPAVLKQVQREAEMLLLGGGAYRADAIQVLEQMDRDFTARNISAGGCADLLAVAIFMARIGNLIPAL